MADRKYSIGRPSQEVRLRNWKGGQAAQLKKAMEILETELNTAMAAQTNQGGKRVVNSRIPKVTGLAVASGFKSFQITFNAAQGINDLLFYEIQKSGTASFADVTTYTTPQTTLTIPTSTERELINVRVRVTNSKFQVGPWSSTVGATGSSNFRIGVTRSDRTTTTITSADWATWVDVASLAVQTTVAAISVSVSPGVHARMTYDTTSATGGNTSTYFGRDSVYTVTFRLLKDGVEDTNTGQVIITAQSVYFNHSGESENAESKTERAIFGVLVSPFETFTNGETVTYTLQAFVGYDAGDLVTGGTYTDRSDASASVTSTTSVIDDPVIIVDNFDILEVIQIS